MIAVDTNILVYAHRLDSGFHRRATECIKQLAEGGAAWAVPWPCLHEFLAVVTSPRVFKKPTPVKTAWAQVQSWLASPAFRPLAEDEGYADVLGQLLATGKIEGPKIHDARIAALVLFHGATELLTADRDFSRFAGLPLRNPLI